MSSAEKIKKAFQRLQKATNKNKLAKARRKWIESNPKINLLNYFYYRYLTNSFEIYLLSLSEHSAEVKK